MRLRRLLIITGCLVAISVLVWAALTVHWGMQQPKPRDFSRLVRATQEFIRDQTNVGQTAPVTVTLPELIKSGYLPASDARVFSEMDISLTVAGDVRRPENILMRVRLPDGSVVSQTMDGADNSARQ
jgi:hypothetical protein